MQSNFDLQVVEQNAQCPAPTYELGSHSIPSMSCLSKCSLDDWSRLSLLALVPALILFAVQEKCNYEFSFVPGIFVDYVEAAKGCIDSRVTRQPLLGIISRTYNVVDQNPNRGQSMQWPRFSRHIQQLNDNSKDGESYKLIYLIRHGFGVHNHVMQKVGSKAWKVSLFSFMNSAVYLSLTEPGTLVTTGRR